jgi:hypothetical protein
MSTISNDEAKAFLLNETKGTGVKKITSVKINGELYNQYHFGNDYIVFCTEPVWGITPENSWIVSSDEFKKMYVTLEGIKHASNMTVATYLVNNLRKIKKFINKQLMCETHNGYDVVKKSDVSPTTVTVQFTDNDFILESDLQGYVPTKSNSIVPTTHEDEDCVVLDTKDGVNDYSVQTWGQNSGQKSGITANAVTKLFSFFK